MKEKVVVIFILTLLIATTIPAMGNTNVEKNNVDKIYINNNNPEQPSKMWPLQFSFDVTVASGAAGNAGAEYANGFFYSTRWASNLIHEYTSAGVFSRVFSIPGVSGLRDLAYDGQYFYGGNGAGTIWKMDFGATPSLVNTLTGSFQCRAIAYDTDLDVIYCKNWGDPVYVVDPSTGAVISTFNLVSITSTYGLAYDNVCGGPYLWVFDQGAGAGYSQYIYQWDLAAGAFTTVSYDVTIDFPTTEGIAGGLFFTRDFVPHTGTLGGLLQGTPDIMFCYEICECNDPPVQPEITGPIVIGEGVEICWTFCSTDPDGDLVRYVIDWGDGLTDETDCYTSGEPIQVCHTYTSQGDYVIRAKAVECTEEELESGWAELPIQVPRSRSAQNLFMNFLQNHPNILSLLQKILQTLLLK